MQLPTTQYFAKGCFLEGTMIATPDGDKAIETLKKGDKVISINSVTGKEEVSSIGDIDVLERDHYYLINGSLKATGEHPFYVADIVEAAWRGVAEVKEVKDLTTEDLLIHRDGMPAYIETIERFEAKVKVYNLLDVTPNNNYFANNMLVHNKGCFPAEMRVSTPGGLVPISELKEGDQVYSFNETTRVKEISTVSRIDVLEENDRYRINNKIIATGSHPFYTTNGLKAAKLLNTNDVLLLEDGSEMPITEIEFFTEEAKVFNLIDVVPNNNYYVEGILVHNKGGCFLAGTRIRVQHGYKYVEDIKAGDKIISYNEDTKHEELSTVDHVDMLASHDYYRINHDVDVTGEHPFYTLDGIKKVAELKEGDVLVKWNGDTEVVYDIKHYERDVVIYNLINVDPNHNYYANDYLVHNKGGSCFLAGTTIETPDGLRNIEDIRNGDTVWSFNERGGDIERATVTRVDMFAVKQYYRLNGKVEVTAEHPFYINLDGELVERKVIDLKIGDNLVTKDGLEPLTEKRILMGDVVVYNLIEVTPNNNYYASGYLVHNKGGFGGGGRSSSSAGHSSSSSKSSGSTSRPSAPKVGTSTAKPGSTIRTADGKTITSSAKRPTATKYSNAKPSGVVGDNGYSPRFAGGYSAPPGSVVYHNSPSMMDYFFLAYLFNSDNGARPENQQYVVVQPDGKEVETHPQPGGVDGLMIFNWIVFILFVIAVLGGIAWLINKKTKKDPPKPQRPAYGYGW